MARAVAKKKPRKKVRFSTITLKVTARQKRSLLNFCKLRHTTPNKLIKKSIKPMLENYADLNVEVRKREVVNQLALF
jgi:hypothetical protein